MQNKEELFAIGDSFNVKIINKVGECYFLSGIPYPFTKDGLKAIWNAEDNASDEYASGYFDGKQALKKEINKYLEKEV